MKSNLAWLISALSYFSVVGVIAQDQGEIRFNRDVRPIMSNTCFACHGPDESANDNGLRLDSFEAAVEDAGAIVPGDPENSLIYQRIIDNDDPMPPIDFRHRLNDAEKAVIAEWIRQGARYETHWSYSELSSPQIPSGLKHQDRIANPIDSFILKNLQSQDIEPSDLADKRTLLRRLSLDLIGMPPTISELDSFLNDNSPKAYQRQVDRLLASPHYGERMAARWLD
ncbi:MAG: DUF1549 domain-containing protein, partial [Planctomycetota bacterium]